jgi:hypothetical protein
MKTITAYQSSDGMLFHDERKCRQHQTDIIGADIDGLLMMFELDITRSQQFKAVLTVMGKQPDLISVLRALLVHLEHGDGEGADE